MDAQFNEFTCFLIQHTQVVQQVQKIHNKSRMTHGCNYFNILFMLETNKLVGRVTFNAKERKLFH